VDLSCFSKSAVQERQESIGALWSVFESPPVYGSGINWDGYDYSQAGTTLMFYLRSPPQAIIPPDLAMKLLRLYTLPSTELYLVPKYHPMLKSYLTELRQLPWPNRDTLFYLLAFFVKF
jgi:hypothetical protein